MTVFYLHTPHIHFVACRRLSHFEATLLLVALHHITLPVPHSLGCLRYIPRILYLNSGGVVDPELKNANGNPKYGYYYSDETSVAEGMKAAAEKLGASGDL